jgi:hypothetical protein
LPGLVIGGAVSAGSNPVGTGAVLMVAFFGSLLGELIERYLFFAAVVAPRMPGGLRT